MNHKMLSLMFSFLLLADVSFAQIYILSCSRWSDMVSRSTRNTPTEISIDSSMITISQGGTNLYLVIKKQNRNENLFIYEVLDPNDITAMATFSPEEMIFDYKAGEFWLRYFIENISRPEADSSEVEVRDTSNLENDTSAVKEDTKIYETADVMPEFPGGKEAMEQFIISNIKYPNAAKKAGIKGLVTVNAVVEKDGSLSEVKVKKDIGGGCGEEAVRVVKLMLTWVPGQVKNEDKRVRVSVSIFFPPK